MRVKGFFFLSYIVTDFLLSNYRLNDGNEYLFQAKDDVSFKILFFQMFVAWWALYMMLFTWVMISSGFCPLFSTVTNAGRFSVLLCQSEAVNVISLFSHPGRKASTGSREELWVTHREVVSKPVWSPWPSREPPLCAHRTPLPSANHRLAIWSANEKTTCVGR